MPDKSPDSDSRVVAVDHPRLARRLARLRIISCFLSEYEWFRRLHGGKWMRSHVDHPVCSCLWMGVPDHATPDYREPGWRGTPEFRDYDSPTNAKSAGDPPTND